MANSWAVLNSRDFPQEYVAKQLHCHFSKMSHVYSGRRDWGCPIQSAQFFSRFAGMSIHDIMFKRKDGTYIDDCKNEIIVPNIYGALISEINTAVRRVSKIPKNAPIPDDHLTLVGLMSVLSDVAKEAWIERRSQAGFADFSMVELDNRIIRDRILELSHTRGLSLYDVPFSFIEKFVARDENTITSTRSSFKNYSKLAIIYHTAADYFVCADYTKFCSLYYNDEHSEIKEVPGRAIPIISLCIRSDEETRQHILTRCFQRLSRV